MTESLSGLALGLIDSSYVFVIGYIAVLSGVIYTLKDRPDDTRPMWRGFVTRAIGINRTQLLGCQLEHPQLSLWIVSGVCSLLGSYIPLGLALVAFVVTWIAHNKIMEVIHD